MPFSVSIDPERSVTRVRFSGSTTGRDIIAATDALVAHPLYDATFDQLWMLTEVSLLDLPPEDMAALVEHDANLVASGIMGRVRVGIVVDEEVRQLAIRFYEYQMRFSGQQVRLFETEATAETWLQEPLP